MSSPKKPEEVQIQLKDALQGLTYPASSVSFVFEGEPAPVGTDSDGTVVLVHMSEDGKAPADVRSLSSSFAVSGFEWKPSTEASEQATTRLSISGVSLDSSTGEDPSNQQRRSTKPSGLFANIQQDAYYLSKRTRLLEGLFDETAPTKY